MSLQKGAAHVVAKGASHTAHLQRVSQAVMDENASRQREHLCLVLQTAKRCREYQAVIVALEFRTVIHTMLLVFLAKPFVG